MVPHEQLPLVADLGDHHGAGQFQAGAGLVELVDLVRAGFRR